MGWIVLAVHASGAAADPRHFSLDGWLDDLHAAVEHLVATEPVSAVWLAGFGTGGALASAPARRTSVCGASPRSPRPPTSTTGPATRAGCSSTPATSASITYASFPPSLDSVEPRAARHPPSSCVEQLAPRPLLLVHGSDDELVPAIDARVLGDAHGARELRIIDGAGHQLRHDPRAVAILLGWLDRQRHTARPEREQLLAAHIAALAAISAARTRSAQSCLVLPLAFWAFLHSRTR